jgi:hypothetical protein
MKYSLTAALCVVLSSFAFAQNMTHRHTLTAHAGANIFLVFNGDDTDVTIDDGEGTLSFDKYTSSATPTFNVTYDYAVKKWFSIGGSVGYNRFQFEFDNLDFRGNDGEIVTGDGGFRASRTSINVRPLFHYGNSGRVDMYSGFRVGFSIWNAGSIGNLQGENIDDFVDVIDLAGVRGTGVLPQFALTLFGLRGYFTEHLGAGFEINAGSPYLVSAGLNYRF